jgi:hypothetical protein
MTGGHFQEKLIFFRKIELQAPSVEPIQCSSGGIPYTSLRSGMVRRQSIAPALSYIGCTRGYRPVLFQPPASVNASDAPLKACVASWLERWARMRLLAS